MFSKTGLKISAGLFAGSFALGVISALSALPANSAPNLCTPRTTMVKWLTGKYQEERRGIGVASKAGVMEFYVSKDGTWTVVMAMTNGMSCILAAGRDWEDMSAVPAGTNS